MQTQPAQPTSVPPVNSEASRPGPDTRRGAGPFLQQHPLFCFFGLAYAFSWILSIPFILSEWGLLQGDFTIAFMLKSFGPFLSAYVVSRTLEDKAGAISLRRCLTPGRVSWRWYLFILVGIPALILLGIVVQPGVLASFGGLEPRVLISYPLTLIAVFVAGGPLGEEPGWRGFALPRLQRRHGSLRGTLLLGLLWTGWHLPDFLTSAQGGGPGTGWTPWLVHLPMFLLLIMALAILLTWIYNHTQGSIFVATLAHASVNVPQVVLVPLFASLDMTGLNLAAILAFGLPALLIVILTRGGLGYRPGPEGACEA